MQSEESARRLIDLGADPARVTVTGSLKFDSLELPDAGRARQAARARAALLPALAQPHRRRRRQHDARRRGGGAARVRAHQGDDAGRAGRSWRRGSPSGSARSSGSRATPGSSRRAAPSCRSTPSRAPTSSCSTRSASWRSSISSRPRCSSAAASSITAATTSSSRRSSASRSSSARTCRTSRRSPTRFLANGAAVQVQSERELDEALLALVTDPVRRARLGAAARALVEANRGAKDKTLDRHRRPAARRRGGARPRPSCGPSVWCIDSTPLSSVYGAAAAWRRAWYARDPVAPAPPDAARHQRRQPARRRQRQDAGRRVHRAAARRQRRAAGDPDARLRAAHARTTA